MAAKSTFSSRLAYQVEVTQGTVVAAWDDTQQLDHVAVDVSKIAQSLIADPTLELTINESGGRTLIKGLRSCEMPASLKLHGSGVTTAAASQMTETPLMRIARHCWGGIHKSNSTTLTGGSTTAPEFTAVTNIVVGCIVGFEDITSPGINTGKVFLRRVIDVTALVVTLDRPLPFTPAALDKVHAMATIYFDESVLVDSKTAADTFSWFVQLAKTGATDLCWQLVGTAAQLAFTGLSRNGLPGLDLTIMAANFSHGSVTAPTWSGTSYGFAQLAIGRDTQFSLVGYEVVNAIGLVDCASIAIEPGIPRVPVDTVTEVQDAMEGRYGYSTEPALTTATVTIGPGQHSGTYETALQADTEYSLSYTQVAAAGKCWGIFLPRCQIGANPTDAAITVVHGAQIKFQARPPADAGTTTLATSKILLAIG